MQKTSTPECKHEAVRLAQTSGKPITHVAREASHLRHLHPRVRARSSASTGPKPFQAVGIKRRKREEIRRLKRELEVVKQERDILKRGMLLRSTTGNEQGYTVGERCGR